MKDLVKVIYDKDLIPLEIKLSVSDFSMSILDRNIISIGAVRYKISNAYSWIEIKPGIFFIVYPKENKVVYKISSILLKGESLKDQLKSEFTLDFIDKCEFYMNYTSKVKGFTEEELKEFNEQYDMNRESNLRKILYELGMKDDNYNKNNP